MIEMPIEKYLADPCEQPSMDSRTAWTLITRSPLHARHEHPRLNPDYVAPQRKDFDIGSAAHKLFLEREGKSIQVIDAKDWRTNAAKDARDEARDRGKIPLLPHDYEAVVAMSEASAKAIEASELYDIFDGAEIEKVAMWKEYDGGWCRARPDLVNAKLRVIMNYKTTGISADPSSFGAGLLQRNGYHVQAYHHLRGVTVVNPEEWKMVWLIQETDPPYATSILGAGPSLVELAKSQWEMALELWRAGMSRDDWPGYSNRIAWIDANAWTVDRWEERMPMVDTAAK